MAGAASGGAKTKTGFSQKAAKRPIRNESAFFASIQLWESASVLTSPPQDSIPEGIRKNKRLLSGLKRNGNRFPSCLPDCARAELSVKHLLAWLMELEARDYIISTSFTPLYSQYLLP